LTRLWHVEYPNTPHSISASVDGYWCSLERPLYCNRTNRITIIDGGRRQWEWTAVWLKMPTGFTLFEWDEEG